VAGRTGVVSSRVATRCRERGAGGTAVGFAGSLVGGDAVTADGPGSAAAATAAEVVVVGATVAARGDTSAMTMASATPVAIADAPIVIQLRGTRARGAAAPGTARCVLDCAGGGSGETIEVESWPWPTVVVRRLATCEIAVPVASALAGPKLPGLPSGISRKLGWRTAGTGGRGMIALPRAGGVAGGRGSSSTPTIISGPIIISGSITMSSTSLLTSGAGRATTAMPSGSLHELSTAEALRRRDGVIADPPAAEALGANRTDTTTQRWIKPSRSVNNYLCTLVSSMC
jgi:hypothetical protein